MTGEECQEVLARASEGAEAKWQEIGRVRQNYLELHAHALRAQEELSRLMEEVEQTRLLYEALLGVRPEVSWLEVIPTDTGSAASQEPTAEDPRGGRKPGRVARRKRKGQAEGGDSPPPAVQAAEGGEE